jgi:hypothetical protein
MDVSTLAYYDTTIIKAVKSFKVQAPGANVLEQYRCILLQQF